MAVLEVTGIVKTFGPLKALTGVDLFVDTGEIVGLIGPNGSGKSTLLHAIAGRNRPDSGTVRLAGSVITGWSAERRARAGLSIKFQLARVYKDQSVQDNLLIAAQAQEPLWSLMRSTSRRRYADRISELLTNFDIEHLADRRAADLSHGEQQWLEIAMAVATRPSALLLDEPTGGMGPEERAQTGTLIRAAAKDCGILIVEHDLEFIRNLCDRITVLHQGHVVAVGTPGEIEQNQRVQEVFLTRV